MTNEELVERVQAGDRDALLTLWEQVRRLVLKQARRWTGLGGMDVDDYLQCGFIALLRAVDTYDASGGAAFSTWFFTYVRAEFHIAAGQHTKRERMDPMQGALSLSAPVGEDFDGGETALEELIEDPAAAAAMEAINENDRLERLSAVLGEVLAELPGNLREAVTGRYWRGEVVDKKAHNAALRKLRHPKISKRLLEQML